MVEPVWLWCLAVVEPGSTSSSRVVHPYAALPTSPSIPTLVGFPMSWRGWCRAGRCWLIVVAFIMPASCPPHRRSLRGVVLPSLSFFMGGTSPSLSFVSLASCRFRRCSSRWLLALVGICHAGSVSLIVSVGVVSSCLGSPCQLRVVKVAVGIEI